MSTTTNGISIQDRWVAGPRGRLFARVWTPGVPRQVAPIILLHDSLGSVELWRGFPEALCEATGRQVVAYDRLGFGKSDPHPGTLALDFIATEADGDFAAVREQLGIGHFALLGHSVGGGMAVNCAARYGAACVALVTESAQAFVEDRTVQGIEQARQLFKDPNQVARLGKYHGAKAQWVMDAWINAWLNPAFASWSLSEVLPRVKCQALAIHGAEDEYGTAKHPAMIAELIGAAAQLEILTDVRHVPHREDEARAVTLLKDFLLHRA